MADKEDGKYAREYGQGDSFNKPTETGRSSRLARQNKRLYKACGNNPRRPDTFGYRSWNAIEDGCSVEDACARGARMKDIEWDIKYGHLVALSNTDIENGELPPSTLFYKIPGRSKHYTEEEYNAMQAGRNTQNEQKGSNTPKLKKITEEQCKRIYEEATVCYENDDKEITSFAIQRLVEIGMNPNTAKILSWACLKLLYGKESLGWLIAERVCRYFLDRISSDYGDDGLYRALKSLKIYSFDESKAPLWVKKLYDELYPKLDEKFRTKLDAIQKKGGDGAKEESDEGLFKYCPLVYEGAKARYEDGEKRKVAIDNLINAGMNETSAHMYFTAVLNMLRGKRFTRNITPPACEYFLQKIYTDYDGVGLRKALQAVDGYIAYRKEHGKPITEFKEVYDEFFAKLNGLQGKEYTLDSIVEDGCFVPLKKLEEMYERLKSKKNLILQGPPGTGKTWLAKRLGYALIGKNPSENMEAVQFHPNVSYEDFVQGYRPSGEDGKFGRADGMFLQMVTRALENPDDKFVIVIEEVNRGNPAQVFGELLTLLEADKRKPSEALKLIYATDDDGRVYIPKNLYVIGTMNLADRSLAMVDLALRRRFAFYDLEPCFDAKWKKVAKNECGISPRFVTEIANRIKNLNKSIEGDSDLGKQFCIGHSFFTPHEQINANEEENWYQSVIDTEIMPLLEEIYADNPDPKTAITKAKNILDGKPTENSDSDAGEAEA